MSFTPDCKLVQRVHASANFGARRGGVTPSILLLHYTGVATVETAIAWLANPASQVSCHYVVDDGGGITQMVPEEMRAWHAGQGSWAGDSDINSASIGIEIQNVGHDAGYPPFFESQIASVIALCRDIVARHAILPHRVLAHSDVAPARKQDPGEKFPWAHLAAAGIGRWVTPAPIERGDTGIGLGERGPAVHQMQALLKVYGYCIEPSGEMDRETQLAVIAFQRHFRPERVDGRIDRSSLATLQALCDGLGGEPLVA